jgi:hypothetical protein
LLLPLLLPAPALPLAPPGGLLLSLDRPPKALSDDSSWPAVLLKKLLLLLEPPPELCRRCSNRMLLLLPDLVIGLLVGMAAGRERLRAAEMGV